MMSYVRTCRHQQKRYSCSLSSKIPTRRRVLAVQDEFALISVPLDTWVGRYVRITTPRHNGTTGLVHRTGNGWVNLQTSLGDVAKRAYDLVVIPEGRANIGCVLGGMGKGDASRGKRYSRGAKGECNCYNVPRTAVVFGPPISTIRHSQHPDLPVTAVITYLFAVGNKLTWPH